MKLISLSVWKYFHSGRVRHYNSNRQRSEGLAKIINLDEYRNTLSEDTRWVRNFLWWADMRHLARKKRLARGRAKSNFRNTPRR